MKPVFCFIDDAHFELDNFREHALHAFERVEMVYARTFDQARSQLKEQRPLCFLLDLYGAQPGQGAGAPPGAADLDPELERPFARQDLHEGLARDDPEAGNVFLRRLHARLHRWQKAFAQSCSALGQGPGYGLANLAQVRAHYPWAAALGYSRKALYDDAVAFAQAGGDGLLQKPQGDDDAAIALATHQQAPAIAQACFQAVDRRLACQIARLGLTLHYEGRCLPLAGSLAQLAPNLGGGGEGELDAEARALIKEQAHLCELEAKELDLVWMLRDWLGSLT